jgi:hypothetical protein
MKHSLFYTLPSLLISTHLFAIPPVIYGDDDRIEVYEATPKLQKLAAAAASMVHKKEITPGSTPGLSQLTQRTLKDWLTAPQQEGFTAAPVMSKIHENVSAEQTLSFCPGEKFIDQPNPAMCSGFLIGPDLIVTAGHCVTLENFCQDYQWVFDFKVDESTQTAGLDIKNENIYSCKKVISAGLDMNLGLDFALVQVDRDVTGRVPVEIHADSMVSEHQELVVIGGPSGLPIKVAGGAIVRRSVHPFFFSANLDTFQGNSGSAVFNVDTGEVEGILVRGEDDFEMNRALMCVQAKKCTNEGCRGEDVSRLTSIPEIAVRGILKEAVRTGDVEQLIEVLSMGTWVDFYGPDKVSPLMVAARRSSPQVVSLLIAAGADATLSDLDGNTPLHHLARILSDDTIESVKILIDAKANLEARNREGKTPLLMAAQNLNLSGVKALLRSGADKSAVDDKGLNVLSRFIEAGDELAVQELTAMGINAPVAAVD